MLQPRTVFLPTNPNCNDKDLQVEPNAPAMARQQNASLISTLLSCEAGSSTLLTERRRTQRTRRVTQVRPKKAIQGQMKRLRKR